MTAESIDTYVVVPEGAEEKQRKEFWLWSDVRQVCHFFGVDPDVGLAPEEVARRLRPDVYGPNDIFKDEKRRLNFFKVFMSEIREPMIILLLVVGVVYSIWGDAFDAITIFIVITVMVLAEVYNEFRAKNAVLALRSIVPRKTTVLRRKGTTTTTTTTAWESGSDSLASPSSASIITEVLNEELVPGDILVLRAGQCIPADARVIESFSLEVDESALTGESVPVRKHAAPLITTTRATNNTTTTTIVTTMAGDDHNEILSDGDFGVDADADAVSVPVHAGTGTAVSQLEKLNTVYAGTTITRGKCHAVVVATGESTQVSQQVLRLMSEQPNTTATTKDKSKKKKKKNKKTPLQKAMKQLALYLTVAAVVCSIIIPLIGWVRGMPWRQAILAGLSIAFATIPEELPILIKAVLAIGALRLSRKNLLIKKLETAEALGAATVVVTDKTGTLTQNKLHLTHVITTPIWRDDDDNNNNNQYHVFGIDQPLQCKNDNNNNNSNNNNNNDVASWTNDLLKSFMLSSELIDKHGELVPQLHGLFNEEEDEEAKAVIIENNVCDSFEKAMLRSLLLQSPTSTSKDHNVSTYRTLMRDQLLDIVDQFQQHDQQKGSRCQGMMHRLLLEIPFDAKRKCITIARDLGVDEDDNSSRRILIVCKGAPESIIALAIGTNTSTTGLDLMAAKGLRLIAIASQQVTVPRSWIEESKGEDNPVSAKHNKYHAPSEDGDLLDFVTKLTSTGKGFTLHGLLAFEDPVRPEVADSIAQCRRAGIEVIMITGDHPATASAVAKKIGLLGHEPENDLDEDSYDQEALMEQTTMMVSDASFIEKARLEFEGGGHAQEQEQQQQQEEGLSDSSRDGANIDVDVDVDVDEHDNLIARLRCQRVYSRATPRDKHSLVWMLQRLLNHRVIVTGDGVNDGPALQLADVGVAMGGKTSTDVAREAAGMILVDDNFATLLVGIREGRKIYDNLRKAIHFYLACKTALVLLMASTITFGVALPLSPIQIIILELFMDLGASTTFIVEREESDKIMNKPPRDPKQRFVNVEFLLWVFSGALSLFLGVLVCFLVGSSSASSSASEDRVARGQSMAMACWLLGHFFLGFNFRSFSSPLTFKHGLASNPGMLLWGLAVAATVVLTATVPWMRSVLKLVKISRVSDWAVVFACSFCFTWWYELAKIIRYFAVELPRQTTSRTRQ